MVETKPQGPTPGAIPGPAQPEKPLTLPTGGGFDFVSFLVSLFVITLLGTGALFGYRYLLLERTLSEQKQQIAQLESELADPALQELAKQVQAIAGGFDKLRPVLEDPIRYGELFWTLRKITEKSVRWTSLGFNETQQLSLVGDAAGWGNVARQLAVFKQDERFSKVELTSASLQQSETGFGIAFSITAQVNVDKLISPQQ